MNNYKTIDEKAAEWGISPRHIQHLCRTGKAKGAVKRGGVWFIPVDAPVPSRNTKAGVKDFRFVGTKKRIFDIATELFMQKGFSGVSLRDIAKSVGIRQSTIYNHFKSKQEILDTIYDFYRHFYLKNRLSLEDMEEILLNKSVMDIILGTRYDFPDEHKQRMSDITKIILQRIGIDERAREIAMTLMVDEGISYVTAVFDRAVELGRLAPLDTHAMAVYLNSVRMFTLFNWIVAPSDDNMSAALENEMTLHKYAVKLMTE